jgi:hypothetical protein
MHAKGAVLLPLALTMPFRCMLALLTKAGAGKLPVSWSMLAPTAGRGGCIRRSRSDTEGEDDVEEDRLLGEELDDEEEDLVLEWRPLRVIVRPRVSRRARTGL